MMTARDDDLPKATSIQGIVRDILVSSLVLSGAWLINRIEALFSSDIPGVVKFILVISEITLATYFVGVLVRASTWSYKQLNMLLETMNQSSSGQKSALMLKRIFLAMVAFIRDCASLIGRLRPREFFVFVSLLILFFGGGPMLEGTFAFWLFGASELGFMLFRLLLLITFVITLAIVAFTLATRFIVTSMPRQRS